MTSSRIRRPPVSTGGLRASLGWAALAVLLVPAVALTAVRILQPTAGPSVMLEAFAPYAVPLYLVAMVLLLMRRRGLAVLVGVPLALHVWWIVPAFTGSTTPPGPNTFTLMTANVLVGKADPAALMRAVVDEDVDVLVLEELQQPQYLELQKMGIDEAFPHHTAQHDPWLTGTVTFSRFPISGEVELPVSQGAHRVSLKTPGGRLTLVAVHSGRAYRHGPEHWVTDHAAILAAATQAKGAVVLAGDFNASPDHQPIRSLEEAGFRDSAELVGAGLQPTWPSAWEVSVLGVPLPSLFRIDHVLVNDRVLVNASRTRVIDGTDHRAVVAELTLQ